MHLYLKVVGLARHCEYSGFCYPRNFGHVEEGRFKEADTSDVMVLVL